MRLPSHLRLESHPRRVLSQREVMGHEGQRGLQGCGECNHGITQCFGLEGTLRGPMSPMEPHPGEDLKGFSGNIGIQPKVGLDDPGGSSNLNYLKDSQRARAAVR